MSVVRSPGHVPSARYEKGLIESSHICSPHSLGTRRA